MARGASRWAYYLGFVGFVSVSLFAAKPTPDLYRFDYGQIAIHYSALLAGLGGFAITVLAVMLGLEALDAQRTSKVKIAAHAAVLRHVALSLTVASISCFIGALLLSEVSAQAASIERARSSARSEVERHLAAMDLPAPTVARLMQLLESSGSPDQFFGADSATTRVRAALPAELSPDQTQARIEFEARGPALDQLLSANPRRHLLIANIVALVSSLLILKSITFLLIVRFPSYPGIGGIQDFVVLGFGGMLLIKLLHMASYGLSPDLVAVAPLLIAAGLAGTIYVYQYLLRREVAILRRSVVEGELGRFTPSEPYFFSLLACFAAAMYLAATFDKIGPPTNLDRLVVGLTTVVASGMLITIQIERPTLGLFLEADRQALAGPESE